MSEGNKGIQVTQDQALTISEYDAQITLAEIHLVRLQNAKMHYLREQDLITEEKSS
ncbi:hypothetical protein [Enterobacter cloacae]|uniref:hypothetical protein n=1 Tax=Enterobacter cloacae TaxID=550 RepID=UPI0020056BEE|nr:hypothetical protein [Enterobacter cloacae]MCK7383362.1 hypothetical protein [Enterobacter cloacae]